MLVSGGYRDAGAWLNTVYWLNLTHVFDPDPDVPSEWIRMTDISPVFNGGRHNHGMTFTNYM